MYSCPASNSKFNRWSLIFSLSVLFCAACGSGAPQASDVATTNQTCDPQAGCVPFTTITKEALGGSIQTASDQVILNDADFRTLWNEYYQSTSPIPPVPTVDFSQEMVLASSLGERPTSGYGIEIVRLVETDTELHVEVHDSVPPPGAVVLTVVTHPSHIIRTRRIDKPVKFTNIEM